MSKHLKGLVRLGVTPTPPDPISPAQVKHAEERTTNTQNKIADVITRFSGSMTFVYIHVIWFATWIGFGVEKYPFGLLTMIVSLEAIFLSTFVMISQNRADAKRQVIANEQWTTVQEEDQQNRQLLHISNQILQLTTDVHAYAHTAAGENGSVAGAHTGAQSGHSAADAGPASSAPRKPAASNQADH
jgi:low affinity Fe/Cu permease